MGGGQGLGRGGQKVGGGGRQGTYAIVSTIKILHFKKHRNKKKQNLVVIIH